MYTYNHWITDIEQPTTAKAFTYTIWFPVLGQRYIGYKTVSDRSKWLTYTSSSKPVKELISNGHTAIYRIIKWFDNAEDARVEEIAAMTSYDVTKRSEYLNQCIGGVKFSTAGKTLSAEHKAKMSAANIGKTLSAETRAKIGAASKGRTKSDETRAKLSAAKKNMSDETRAKMSAAQQNRSAETRAKISASNKGKTRSDETRAKMSAANIGKTLSAETRAKMSVLRKGKTHSDETRAKISASQKGKTLSAEHKAKMSAANIGKTHSDETRAKMSVSHTGQARSAETRAKISAAKQIGLYVTPSGTFKTLTDAAIIHNCDAVTIRNRCNSTSNKFKDWLFIPNP